MIRRRETFVLIVSILLSLSHLAARGQDDPAPLLKAPVDFALDQQGRVYVVDPISRGGLFRFDDFTGGPSAEIGIDCSDSFPGRASEECRLVDPHSVFVSPVGRIYVADATGRIIVMDPQTQRWTSIPSEGAAPVDLFVTAKGDVLATLDSGNVLMPEGCNSLSLENPQGIYADSHGRMYVTERKNHQIVRIDSNCAVHRMGSQGTGEKQFDSPAAVALDAQGRIYVADSGNHRIVRMDDFEGNGWATFGRFGESAGELSHPKTIVLDSKNRIYIGDFGNGRIVRIDDLSGKGWMTLGLRRRERQFASPVDVAADAKGRIFVADQDDARVVRVNDMNGTGWMEWHRHKEIALAKPVSIFVKNDGTIFVTDAGNRQILWLHANFKEAQSIALALLQPKSIFVDRQERIFLTDIQQDAIAKLDLSAAPIKLETHWGNKSLDQPTGIHIDTQGRIYVADESNRQIVRMDTFEGKNRTVLSFPESGKQSVMPADVFVDRQGYLYILDALKERIVRLHHFSKKYWVEFGSRGFGTKQFYQPSGIFVDSKNRIYIADTGNRRIVRIDDLTGKGWATLGETAIRQIRYLPAS